MKTAFALLPAVVLAACASSTTPAYDAKFGDAVRTAREAMVLNPRPAPVDVSGLDGGAAHEAIGRYHDSFAKPPPVVNVINIGGEMGSSSAGR